MSHFWFAIYTKPKHEDSVTQRLNGAGIEALSPKIQIRKFSRGKYAPVVEPLFPCYVFASFDPQKYWHMITYTRGVRYVVGKEHPIVVPPEIVDAIRERMEDGVIVPKPEKLAKGDRVLISEGPFKDFYGIFEREVPGRERAVILLEVLQSRLEIEPVSIRKV